MGEPEDRAKVHDEVIIGVDPTVRGMSRLADTLEATPFLPSRMALRQELNIARRASHGDAGAPRVAVVLSSNHPELAFYAHLLHADRLAIFHDAQIELGASAQARLRALFAAVDLCIVPDAASERAAAALGADPDRLAHSDAPVVRRLFSEPPRKPLRRAVFEMAASLALDAAERTGVISALERLSPDRGVNIVNYHRVLPLSELVGYTRPQMALAAPIFEAQLEAMAEQRGFAPLDRIHEREAEGQISITFDDGYEDNLRVALPILQRFSTPACIFLVSGLVGQPDALWWDRVGLALFAWWRAGAEGELPACLPERARGLAATDAFEAARNLISEVLTDLNAVPEATRAEAVAAAEALIPETEAAGRTMLSWEEVEHLAEAGVTFGAHTRSHVPLDELSREEAVTELVGSQDDIEARVGAQAYKTCALPRGRLGELSEADLRATFTSVMTTDAGVHDPEQPDLFVKRRDGRMLTLAGRHHPAKLRLELSGWVDRLRAAYQARR